MTDKNLVPYPFNVAGFLLLQDNCTFFDACVRQIATDVIGQGWYLSLKEDATEDKEMQKRIEDFLNDPNTDEDSLEDVLERCIQDWAGRGWFCMEVSRDTPTTGPVINGLYQVPAHTVKVHRDGAKYCQRRGVKYRWFKRFGYEHGVNVEDGSEGDTIPPEKQAHEMIFYRNYYGGSSWYGCPNILPAVGAIKGLIGIRDYNLSFFENYGVPAAIVTIEGEWEEDATKLVSDFIDAEIKGSNNAHKTLVLNPGEGGSVKWVPLIASIKEGHFKLYHVGLRDEVLVAYRMPPYRIGISETGSLGGSTASESTKIYISSIVNPLKRVIEQIMTQKIIHDGFKCDSYEFVLEAIDIRDVAAEVNMAQVLFGMGVLTRVQVAERLNLPAIPEEDPDAKTYYISNAYKPLSEAGAPENAVQMMERQEASVRELSTKLGDILKAARQDKLKAQAEGGEPEATNVEPV